MEMHCILLEMKERKPLLLRIPSNLFEELKVWARQELRSINRQIEFILREAVSRNKDICRRNSLQKENEIKDK